jgi:group I intron endonuclease
MLRRNLHNNKHLQHSYNKYGEKAFEFLLIEKCIKDALPIREQWYIDNLKPTYNICTLVEGRWGLQHVQSTKDKIRESVKKFHKEIGLSQESKDKIAKTLRGTKQSPETIEKRKQANIKAWELKKLNNI